MHARRSELRHEEMFAVNPFLQGPVFGGVRLAHWCSDDCHDAPALNETYSPSSVPTYSSSLLRASVRTTWTGPPDGRSDAIDFHVWP